MTLLLVGCGGGSSAPTGNAGPAAGPPAPLAAAPVIVAATVTGASDIRIDNYTLVSSTRISRTVYEYTYTADGSNWGTAAATITATLASTAAATTVVEGALNFGDVAEGATEISTDTFTIRQDRSQPFTEDSLVWTGQATPLALTTFELIDQALADGAIDAETALLYKVFYEFHDERLPAEYRGRDDGFPEATAIQDAIDTFSSLSQPTRNILTPFLLPPDNPASWYQLRLPQPTAQPAGPTIAAVSTGGMSNPVPSSVGTEEDVTGPIKRLLITQANGKVAVYWDNRYPDDRTAAFRIAGSIDQNIWPKLTALLGEPPVDSSGVLQVRIADIQSMPIFYSHDVSDTLGLATNRCGGGVPVVYLDRGGAGIVQTAAHEITHAIEARFTVSSGCAETAWLAEATATWAEHYTYPQANTEHVYAPDFLDEPTLSLDTTANAHEYGAYLWFLYITGGDASGTSNTATQRVLRTWNALVNHDSLGAINEAISDLGGLEEKWPEFALYNWNRVSAAAKPYRYYFQWDQLYDKARESTTPVLTSGDQVPEKVMLNGALYKGYFLRHTIQPLGAEYWHFDFRYDQQIRRVRVMHPYADGSQPWAKVQVLVKRRNQPWELADADDDWTGHERKTLCRDKPDENFEEVVVVISNSEFAASNVLDDPGAGGQPRTFVEASALGCTNWKGTVDFSAVINGSDTMTLNEVGMARNVTLEMEFDRFTHQSFRLVGGTVTWNHAGSVRYEDGDFCSGESTGGYDLAGAVQGFDWIGDFGGCCAFTPTVVPAYNLRGIPITVVPPPPSDYVCTDAQEPYGTYFTSPNYGVHDRWLDFGGRFISIDSPTLYDWDPTGNTLHGTSFISVLIRDPNGQNVIKSLTYTWDFTKNGTFPAEPEL